jgi:hypothetical protein
LNTHHGKKPATAPKSEPDVAALLNMSDEELIKAYQRSPDYLKSAASALPVAAKAAPQAAPAHSKLILVKGDDETEAQAIARAVVSPRIRAATTLAGFASKDFGEIDVNALTAAVAAKCKTVAEDNDLSQVEAMLVSQATTLEAIFHSLARQATGNLDNSNSHWFEMYLRMALKAQSQCRTTLETLALIKNPKSVAFVRQANIANGPQQVNNRTRARKPKPKKRQSKLLEQR